MMSDTELVEGMLTYFHIARPAMEHILECEECYWGDDNVTAVVGDSLMNNFVTYRCDVGEQIARWGAPLVEATVEVGREVRAPDPPFTADSGALIPWNG